MSIFFILAAILLLCFMVLVHELGHFVAARWMGIPVKEFAIGFGPKICSWKSKKYDTIFFLRLIPAGGYCMFYGEDDAKEKEKFDPRNLANYSPWKRMFSIAMGPIMNFVLALVAATLLYCYVGIDMGGEYGYTVVQTVTENSPAAEAGILPGDIILSVNGEDSSGLQDETQVKSSAQIGAYREGDAPLELRLLRGEDVIETSVAPRYDETENRMLMGVTLLAQYTPDYQPLSIFQAVRYGADYCIRTGGAVLHGLKELVTTPEGFAQSSGPVGIVQLIAEETQENGWLVYVQLLVMISVNLGLFNLIPIPGLDGSRIVFLLIEGVRRKPVPAKVEACVHLSGYAVLLLLMLVMTFKDVLKIFN